MAAFGRHTGGSKRPQPVVQASRSERLFEAIAVIRVYPARPAGRALISDILGRLRPAR